MNDDSVMISLVSLTSTKASTIKHLSLDCLLSYLYSLIVLLPERIQHETATDTMSSQNDAHPQGGSLTDMAVEGTTVPEDAAKPRLIPSKARPDQIIDPSNDPNDLGSSDLAGAADNAQDISRVHSFPPTLSLHESSSR